MQRQAQQVLAVERIAPVRLRRRPMMARSVVVLPTPLRPSRVTVSPWLDVEVDAVQRMALAVPGMEVADCEQGRGAQPCAVPM